MIAGVCGGLGKYFDIDPVIFRIIFVVLVLMGGFGILLYLILVFIIPLELESGSQETRGQEIKEMAQNFKKEAHEFAQNMRENKPWHHSGLHSGMNIIALFIILIGVVALFSQLFPMPWFSWHVFWPAMLILLGLLIIFRGR